MPGDKIITSGLAGTFPKGVAVGEVVEVSQSNDGMRNEAVVNVITSYSIHYTKLYEIMKNLNHGVVLTQ